MCEVFELERERSEKQRWWVMEVRERVGLRVSRGSGASVVERRERVKLGGLNWVMCSSREGGW